MKIRELLFEILNSLSKCPSVDFVEDIEMLETCQFYIVYITTQLF